MEMKINYDYDGCDDMYSERENCNGFEESQW